MDLLVPTILEHGVRKYILLNNCSTLLRDHTDKSAGSEGILSV